MRVGISLTSGHADAKDPRQGARWMIERTAAARRAGLDSLFLGDHHVSPTPYYQNTSMLGRLLAEWGALFFCRISAPPCRKNPLTNSSAATYPHQFLTEERATCLTVETPVAIGRR